jgi:hypothetical protein
MGIQSERTTHMDRRALLTDREREVLSGDVDDVKNLSQYQSKIKSRVRQRIGRLEEDLNLLREVEPELWQEIEDRLCISQEQRLEEVESEIDRLWRRIDDE